MTIDHVPRINQQRDQAAEAEAVVELNRYAAPLFAVITIIALILLADAGWALWQRWQNTEHDNAVMVMCLNGRHIAVGDSIVHCNVVHYELVNLNGRSGS